MLANNLTPLNVKCTLIKLVTQGKVGIITTGITYEKQKRNHSIGHGLVPSDSDYGLWECSDVEFVYLQDQAMSNIKDNVKAQWLKQTCVQILLCISNQVDPQSLKKMKKKKKKKKMTKTMMFQSIANDVVSPVYPLNLNHNKTALLIA
ncbi:hypothetical protein Tco_0016918 [Tanacetum coccineum]